MSLYIENAINSEANSIFLDAVWHQNTPLLAVSSFTQEKGGVVTIFDELGEMLQDINYPVQRYHVTALAWHPDKTILATGWENGDFRVWNGFDRDFTVMGAPHKAPLTLLGFSERGGRLISCDSTGSLVGWKVDNKGQIVTAFHLDIKESITHLTFRLTIKNYPDFDVEGLAKAAVNGDEDALDIFSDWRPKTTARKITQDANFDNAAFYIGTVNGAIYYVNQQGSCLQVLNTEGIPLSFIIHHPLKDSLIVMMEGLTVGHFIIDVEGNLTELAKVKLSGRQQSRGIGNQGMVWAGNNCFAILTGDLLVRIWDIETNDNYVLPITLKNYTKEKSTSSTAVNEIFTCLSYCKLNQTLCAGTNIGRIYFWTKTNLPQTIDVNWELNNVNSLSGTIKHLKWGSIQSHLPLLCVNCVTSMYIMKEQNICCGFSPKIWAIQKSANSVFLETANLNYLLKADIQITDLFVTENYLILTNNRIISIYKIDWNQTEFTLKLEKNFPSDNEKVLMYQRTVITLTQKGVVLRNLNNNQLFTIQSNNNEGEIIGIDLTQHFLTLFTMEGYLKVYNLEENEPKLHTNVRNLYDFSTDFEEIIQAKINANGTKIALILAAANLIPDGKLYVLNVESDEFISYDFCKYAGFMDDFNDDGEKSYFDKICSNRVPLNLFWDLDDNRLLVCNAKKIKYSRKTKSLSSNKDLDEANELKNSEHIIATMFISSEIGILIHDIKKCDLDTRLLSLTTPYIVTLQKLRIIREVMTDFNGLEECDKATRDAVLDFSFNLTLGNMDNAFKSIKLVQSDGVWRSLAKMCVKTRRLDVAGVCLGHIGNAKAAMALRLAVNDDSLENEAKVAVLAIHLNMLDEAEDLYMQCGRYDLLNKLLRTRNKYDESLKIAETKDRIHLKNTHFHYARYFENNGNYKEAILHYEKANTHKYDIPRMLMEQPEQLEIYMNQTKDIELLRWWGQYIESQGDMELALKIYANTNDIYSQVRVLCYLNEEHKAAELARNNNDKAAYYHMARYYETNGNCENAISFFTKANAYNNAIRLCKENQMSDELWNIATVAGNREKLECAYYFEQTNAIDKAILLYYRAGMLHKALDLSFKSQQYDILQEIASDLDANSDPALIEKCADYFINNEQYEKAVDLLGIAKKYKSAIEICLNHNVQLNEDLVEKLTPDDKSNQLESGEKVAILEKLGESLMLQGSYHLATKKFTQAGDKVRAMKALLKSGDTDKIVFFASVSRQKEIYVMAANYLQSLDWQNKPEILRNIITFYSKGKALDLLANFFVACAQVEIDEFQNYEKAFEALGEAARNLAKVSQPKDVIQHQKAIEVVQQRMTFIKRFIDIRRLFERNDVDSGMTQCRQLLLSYGKELEDSVRRGDIYALMIHHSIKNDNFAEAKQLFQEFKQILDNVPITYYLNKETIEALASGLGIPVTLLIPSQGRQDSGDQEFVEEILDE